METSSRRVTVVLAAIAAGLLLWLAVVSHAQRSCVVGEAPYVTACADVPDPGSASELDWLKRRIAATPGDSTAYAGLSRFPLAAGGAGLLRAAATLAPNDPNVLRAQAVLALQQGRLADAAPLLVQLSEHYDYLTGEPSRTLARLIAMGEGQVLKQHLRPGGRWFPIVLGRMLELKLPVAPAMPLVIQASANGVLPPGRIRAYMRGLKTEGNWADAYGLWVGQHKGRVPLLFNAGFDRSFEPDGFDWEVVPPISARHGLVAETRPFEGRGQVLEVSYLGRSVPTPVVRQYLFLGSGTYRLSGQYMTSKLRTEGGLAWAVKCAGQEAPAGRTAGLLDTQGKWMPFDFEFTLSADCGPVASLQLETFAQFEAAAGIRGRAHFDAFFLQPLP